jgi:hypothetical protein
MWNGEGYVLTGRICSKLFWTLGCDKGLIYAPKEYTPGRSTVHAAMEYEDDVTRYRA